MTDLDLIAAIRKIIRARVRDHRRFEADLAKYDQIVGLVQRHADTPAAPATAPPDEASRLTLADDEA